MFRDLARRGVGILVGAALMVSLCIACSSVHPSAARSKVSSSSTTATTIRPSIAPSTAVPATPASTVGSTTAVPAALLRCQPSNLSATVTDEGGATGHGGEVIVLRLVAGTPCILFGYPGLGLKGPGGESVPLRVDRQTQRGFLLPYVPPAAVRMTAGSAASFGIEWINTFNPTATNLLVTPPDAFTTVSVVGGVQGGVPNNAVVTVTAVTSGQLPGPGQGG